jgi:hypothetical protein
METNAGDPLRHESSILSGDQAPGRTSPAAEHDSPGFLPADPQIVIAGLAGLLCRFKAIPAADSFVLRLWRCGFLDVRFATGFALEGVKIRQPAKAQRFPNEPHWSGAADASRPLERRPIRVRTQHKNPPVRAAFVEKQRPEG